MKINKQPRLTGAITILLLSILTSCSISLISKYDEVIDHGITDFQRRIDLHLIQKQRNPTLLSTEGFYDSVFVDLQLLKTRASSVPKNSETSTIISKLIDQVKTIETIDKINKEKSAFYQDSQTTIDRDCGEALTLELAKKRGD